MDFCSSHRYSNPPSESLPNPDWFPHTVLYLSITQGQQQPVPWELICGVTSSGRTWMLREKHTDSCQARRDGGGRPARIGSNAKLDLYPLLETRVRSTLRTQSDKRSES